MILASPQELTYKPAKIISLVPSQTELLHFFGLENEVAAITKFCIHPASWFKNKVRIGGTKTVDIEKIISLQPDLIIANDEENVKEQVKALAKHFPVWVTSVHDLETANKMIADIGQLTKKQEIAESLIHAIDVAFADLATTPKIMIPAAYLIWNDPYMTVGGDCFINDMMKRAGFRNVFEHELRYPEISVDDLKNSGCRVLMLSSEPFPFSEKHLAVFKDQLPGIIPILVDGEMFSWYGNRLLLSASYFFKLAHEVSMSND